jgi:hypothetical protein
MKRISLTVVLLVFAVSVAGAQTPAPAAAPRPTQPPAPTEAASVDAILAALYAGVSHPPNEQPDWSHLRTICLKEARFIPPQRPTGEFVFLSTEDFITRVSSGIASRAPKKEDMGFFEREISRKADCWGNICQVFSTYEGRHLPADAKPFVRGINAIHLVKDGNRWWVVNVFWDQESPEKPISAAYLPKS